MVATGREQTDSRVNLYFFGVGKMKENFLQKSQRIQPSASEGMRKKRMDVKSTSNHTSVDIISQISHVTM